MCLQKFNAIVTAFVCLNYINKIHSNCFLSLSKSFEIKLSTVVFSAGEKPFPCVICRKRFTEVNQMKKHMSTVHTDSKVHQCDRCDKAYKVRVTFARNQFSVSSRLVLLYEIKTIFQFFDCCYFSSDSRNCLKVE